MTDKMPEVIFVGQVSGHGIWGEWVDGVTHKDNARYIRADIHEKAVKERDALKSENDRLQALVKKVLSGRNCNIPVVDTMPPLYTYSIDGDLLHDLKQALQGGE